MPRKSYYWKHREQEIAKAIERHRRNPDRARAAWKRWEERHIRIYKPLIRGSDRWKKKILCNVKYKVRRRHTDIQFRILENTRARISMLLRRGRKINRTVDLLGCSLQELQEHLTRQFRSGMTWQNYGHWHIDHIQPCGSFNLLNPEEQRRCFHYTNLQPLWAKENLKKGSKFSQKG